MLQDHSCERMSWPRGIRADLRVDVSPLAHCSVIVRGWGLDWPRDSNLWQALASLRKNMIEASNCSLGYRSKAVHTR